MLSMTIKVATSCTMRVSIIARVSSTVWYMFRSEIERETIWPVTILSCPGPSRRCSVRRILVRNQCCEVVARRPEVVRRMMLRT